jgi:hypothetical protein
MNPVDYHTLPNVPGRYFACVPYNVTLSTTACAGMYTESKRAIEPRHPACRGCAIGAHHAGDTAPPPESLFGRLLCCRCHRKRGRLLYGALCISCVNRQYEVIRGRNGKGNPPVKAARTFHLVCRAAPASAAQIEFGFQRSTSMVEAIYRVLRTEPRRVRFARSRHRVPGAFFTLFNPPPQVKTAPR